MIHKIVPLLGLFVCLAMIMPALSCAPCDPLTHTVIKADLIVLGTITDNRTEVVTVMSGNTTGKFAYTFFTLSVEKVIKGNPDTKEVLIKVEGGPIGGGVYQGPTGAYFLLQDRILASLHLEEDNVYIIPSSGVVWSERPTIGAKSIVGLQESIGRIIQIMLANNIPIALPHSEWPPLPAPVPVSPPKNLWKTFQI
jgi:hypothetical protein